MPDHPPTRLALIGMSGIGKSYWAKQLDGIGWARLDCDAMIAERLGELIEIKDGEDAVLAVGRWMGMPWTEGYAEREQQYLDLEREVTGQALDVLAGFPADQPAVLDTTGSVIYTGELLSNRIKQQCKVVYFEASAPARQLMVEQYIHAPKPVLWQGGFAAEPGESHDEALGRCYTALLDARAQRYQALADQCIRSDVLRKPGLTARQVEQLMVDRA